MTASIKDVAKRAGVSISTVSRIINNSAGVKESKAIAVKEAMEYYNYEPNQFGRGLVKQASDMIGVYFENVNSLFDISYNRELLRGIENQISKHGYSLLLINDHRYDSEKPKFLRFVNQKKIDGLILGFVPEDSKKLDVIKKLLDEDFPIGYVGDRFHENGFQVYAQYESYMYRMLRKIYEKGHRRVGIYYGDFHQTLLLKAIDRAKNELPQLQVYMSLIPSIADIETYKKRLQESCIDFMVHKKCTILWSESNDDCNMLLAICNELGRPVPEELSLVCSEHSPNEGEKMIPSMTAYYVPAYEMGKELAAMLINSLKGMGMEKTSAEFKPRYIERGSLKDIN